MKKGGSSSSAKRVFNGKKFAGKHKKKRNKHDRSETNYRGQGR
jgi:hypothetical protein